MSGDALPADPDSHARSRAFANVPVVAGDVIAEKYVVEKVIGAGGVGVVVSARHTLLAERVAIKLLQRSACTSDENLARFDREGRALARLKSPHVARVMDVGALPSGEPFMVMELLDGNDLSAVIRRDAPVPIERAVSWIVQACEAVVEAHAVGIIHRDLKPANLFLCRDAGGDELIKVLDFGISKLLRDAAPRDHGLTQATSVIGSPLYMSPEQMEAPAEADERSDIWALGTLLYELVSGAAPFDAPTIPLLCAQICTGEPRPLTSHLPGVPEGLARVVHRCLANRPEDRFQSVADLVFALAPFGPPSASYAAERIARVARSAGLPVSDEPVPLGDGAGPVSTVLPRSALPGATVAIADEDTSGEGPRSSRRRWSWSSAPPPPPSAGVERAPLAAEPSEGAGTFAKQILGAALAACLAVYAVSAFSGRPASAELRRGVWHVVREAGVVHRLAVSWHGRAHRGDGPAASQPSALVEPPPAVHPSSDHEAPQAPVPMPLSKRGDVRRLLHALSPR
jgi:serine/threonine-protein kinase